MKPFRTAVVCGALIAVGTLTGAIAAQQRVNSNSNTDRGGADVKQVAGRKIGNIATRGNIIHLELDEGVITTNLFDLDKRTIRFTPVAPTPADEGGPADAGFRAENLPLQWDAATGSAFQGSEVRLTKFRFPFSGKNWDAMTVSATGLISFGGGYEPPFIMTTIDGLSHLSNGWLPTYCPCGTTSKYFLPLRNSDNCSWMLPPPLKRVSTTMASFFRFSPSASSKTTRMLASLFARTWR